MPNGLSDLPTPPPGLVPPFYPSPGAIPGDLNSSALPTGYTRSRGFSISPLLIAWIPAVALTSIFVLTMIPWVGSYVGGHAVYTQNPWRAAFGGSESRVYRNFQLEELLKKESAWPEKILDSVSSDFSLLVPYFLILIVTIFFAWSERLFTSIDRSRLPPALHWIVTIWPFRNRVILGLTVLAFAIVEIQSLGGFGLERAMQRAASEKFAAEKKKEEGSPSALIAIEFKEQEEYARYKLERTTWMTVALLLHILVVLALLMRVGLERRGRKPPPRFVLQY